MRERIQKIKRGTEYLNYGRDIFAAMAQSRFAQSQGKATLHVLDIGFGTGADLANIRRALPNCDLGLYGIDSDAAHIARAEQQGIIARQADIERARLPFADEFFDLVLANQVLEHTKEIFWIVSEISRVLNKRGALIVGVPNLASLHNRVLLALGEQPTCIELLGPHVRGFTRNGFVRFIESAGYFRVLETQGANFYPFPPILAQRLSRWLPTWSVGLVFLCERTNKGGTFSQVLANQNFETNFFAGDVDAVE